MSDRKIRVGIDVGGTHTKAVALDNTTHEIVGQSVVMTTHDHPMGVAAGVIECFRNVIATHSIDPADIVFIGHSTTQATNALLEGDVAKIGILGMAGGGIEGFLAKRQSNIPDIDLGTGRSIRTVHAFLKLKRVDEASVEAAIVGLVGKGAGVIVASKAFGVDGIKEENLVRDVAERKGVLVCAASDISKLYGLSRRTRTAAINGSILPKMMETADSTERSVRKAEIQAPLMIMRGDGGVMSVDEMRKRPVLTMLSGPAASVMGALLYLRASNGVYFEVGGTSTNIGVIKNGRPAVEYTVVGGHRTYVNSLDVRVLGVAGGSMVRASDGALADVGPRSAHIAGLGYAVYTPRGEIVDPRLEFFAPKPGDPADYVRIRLASGKAVTITNSCAANVLGLVGEKDYSRGDAESARLCMRPLADFLGLTVEETATRILAKAHEKIEPVLEELAAKYKLERDQMDLVGVGGGAAALIPFSAAAMGLRYSIPAYAEVISSIGVALALIRDVVERIIPNPSTADIARIKKEAAALAIKNGAVPATVEVHVEIDPQTSRVTAIAMGSNEAQAADLLLVCGEDEARGIAAESMRADPSELAVAAESDSFRVFARKKGDARQVRVVDRRGFVKVQSGDARVAECSAADWERAVSSLWESTLAYRNDMVMTPDVFLCVGGKLLDFSNAMGLEDLLTVMRSEFEGVDGAERVILVASKAASL